MKEMRHEVEVDTALAELWQEDEKLRNYQDSRRFSLASHVGIRPHYVGKIRTVNETTEELIALAQARVDDPETMAWKRSEIQRTLDTIKADNERIAAIKDAVAPLNAEYVAQNWNRFFLVQNNNGHIHSSMQCSSCNWRTRFAWLPTLSGLTEKDAVDEHGPRLCSICFPSAPVEWTVGIAKKKKG